MVQFKADTKELAKITKALDGLHKSAFPVAARQTLNDLAFNAKKKELQKTAANNFTVRSRSFFNKFSKVEKASGLDVSKMKANMGMIGKETENFHAQEVGGTVEHSTIPNESARISNSDKKRVRKVNYAKGRVVRPRSQKKKDFPKNAAIAFKQNKLLKHKGVILKIKSIKKTRKGIVIKSDAIYRDELNRNVRITGTDFIQETAMESMKKLNRFYAKNANQRFKKYLK